MSGLCWADILDCTSNNVPRSTLANAVKVLQHDPMFAPEHLYFDSFLDRVLVRDGDVLREYRDDDDTRITVYMQEVIGLLTIPETQVGSAVRYVAFQRQRHAVRDWLRTLKWDGEPRIAHALEDYWSVESSPTQPSDYVRAVSANLFIGLVARVMQPGCQLDVMIILEGAQGIGKSKSLRILGGAWYMLAAESVASKDFYQTIKAKWLIEIGELDAMSKADREKNKIAISTPVDRYRTSYGRRAQDHPRECVFVGTTNRDDYGNDDTGLRRYWPVRCGDTIDLESIARWREQLFAEAVCLFDAGATWWEVPSAAQAVQHERQHEDAWTATVLSYLEFKDETTSTDVLVNSPLKMREADVGRLEQNRISSILTLNGWRRQTIRVNGRPVKGFRRLSDA